MKFVLLLAGLLALVTAAPTSPSALPVFADAKVEAFSKRESLADASSQVSSILATRNGVPLGATSDISSLLNAAKTSFEIPPPGLVYLCSEHEYRGDCAAFFLNKCVNFDGMSKKTKSIMQAAGAVCAYWSHNDCESGGATTLIKIYSDDHEELRPTLSPLDSMLSSGRCFPPAEWYQHHTDEGEVLAPRGYPLGLAGMTADVTAGSIYLCSEHDHKGDCKTFTMGTEGSCVRFDGVYMKAKSLFQPKGTVCQYWPHDECEDGGGPATSLLNIYSFEHDEDRRILFPYDGLFATGKCWGADQFAATQDNVRSKDTTPAFTTIDSNTLATADWNVAHKRTTNAAAFNGGILICEEKDYGGECWSFPTMFSSGRCLADIKTGQMRSYHQHRGGYCVWYQCVDCNSSCTRTTVDTMNGRAMSLVELATGWDGTTQSLRCDTRRIDDGMIEGLKTVV